MDSSSNLEIHTPIQYVPGVGAERAPLFERLKLRKAIDLLFYFPRSYQEVTACKSVSELKDGLRVTLSGIVVDTESRFGFSGNSTVGVLVAVDGGGYVRCVWYNQPFRRDSHPVGQRLLARGVVQSSGVAYQMRHPEITVLAAGEPVPDAKPRPVYPLTEGLNQLHISRAVRAVLPLADQMEEALPMEVRQAAAERLRLKSPHLLGIADALRQIHEPDTMEQTTDARTRFIFQELFVLQLALAVHRHAYQHERPAPSIQATPMIHNRILKRFPFQLTQDQLRVIEEIRGDMAKTVPMNRLIQGDVGTGKTALAQYAMLNAVASQHQAALMAPTELLAKQHSDKLKEQLRDSRVMIELLISSMSAPDKRELLQRIAIGTVDIVVGTQALLSEHVEFANLGLLVIDEQHRFGVEQRAALRSSRTTPHYLVMTATPIPRTLALTLFGDLDVSTVRERPPGQSVVQTYLLKPELHERWWTFVKQQVAAGRQAYVVVPRVDADQDQETQGAVQWWEMLSQGALSGLRVELLHGRMESSHKQAVLERFAQGGIDVLVATTVIEVGIDVPNVSVMTIIDADRLGLAQLHQLRGRVGRGKHPGFVSLIPNPAVLDEDTERLELFAKIHDGFKLAEMDLQRRGPGELIGTKQTGLPEFRIADLIRDEAIVMVARELATLLVAADPQLERPEHAKLLRQVLSKHGRTMSIGDVG